MLRIRTIQITILIVSIINMSVVQALSNRQNYGYRLEGDVNHDCIVNIFDLSLIGKKFNIERGKGYRGFLDTNKDGIINILDLTNIGMNYGNVC